MKEIVEIISYKMLARISEFAETKRPTTYRDLLINSAC